MKIEGIDSVESGGYIFPCMISNKYNVLSFMEYEFC